MELIDEPLTDSELHSLIRMADADNNGKIDYEGEKVIYLGATWFEQFGFRS